MDLPSHRRPYASEVLSSKFNAYAKAIQQMREETKDAKGPLNQPLGPIGHALETIKDFGRSASKWTGEHLTRFQVIVVDSQNATHLYPEEFFPSDNDSTMVMMKKDGFFNPTVKTISQGDWKKEKLYHYVFLSLMMLLRGGDRTPSPRTSPKMRASLPRDAKSATSDILDMYYQAIETEPCIQMYFPASWTIGPGSPSSMSPRSSMAISRASSQLYRESMSTTDSRPVVDYGPRETLTYTLFHQFLSYLGTVEQQKAKSDIPLWIPMPDSSRFAVAAAGKMFISENDGSIYTWHKKKSGLRKVNEIPICSLECKREWHCKSEDEIIAQEAAELIGLAAQNCLADKPSVRMRDEAFLICCHKSSVHITSAIVSEDYIRGLTHDNLNADQVLIVKRGNKYDLMNKVQREQACAEIIGLLRYLSKGDGERLKK